jgi:hypothetical protein
MDEVTVVTSPAAHAATPAAKVVPLTAELRRLCVTVSKAFADKLEAAKHARPDLTLEQILEKGVDLLLEKSAKAKGLVERPLKTPRPSKDASRIPAHLRREAMERAREPAAGASSCCRTARRAARRTTSSSTT